MSATLLHIVTCPDAPGLSPIARSRTTPARHPPGAVGGTRDAEGNPEDDGDGDHGDSNRKAAYTSGVADTGALYRAGRTRITELVGRLGPDDARRSVDAWPGWTVQDVVAHLAGACADALAGRLDGVTTAAWADAQVAARRERTLADLLRGVVHRRSAAGGGPRPVP